MPQFCICLRNLYVIFISYHDFGRYKVVSLAGEPLHLPLLLPVYRVIEASLVQGATGGLQVSAWKKEYHTPVRKMRRGR